MPELTTSYYIETTTAYIIDNDKIPYDVILGRPELEQFGIHLDFQKQEIGWKFSTKTIPMKNSSTIRPLFGSKAISAFLDQQDIFETYTAQLLDSKYEEVDVREVASSQTHLTTNEQLDLLNILQFRSVLFSGCLGTYTKRKIHLQLRSDAVLKHFASYALPILQ